MEQQMQKAPNKDALSLHLMLIAGLMPLEIFDLNYIKLYT
jgi:hypothetical protein